MDRNIINSQKLYKGNEDFFQTMKDDFVHQQIFGEVRCIRGIINLLKRSKSFWAFLLADLCFCLIFIFGLIGLLVVIFGAVDGLMRHAPGSDYIFMLPWLLWGFLGVSLGIRIFKDLISATIKNRTKPYPLRWFILGFSLLGVFSIFLYILFIFWHFLIHE